MLRQISVGRQGHRLTRELLEQVLVIDSHTSGISRAREWRFLLLFSRKQPSVHQCHNFGFDPCRN